jgi:hypothetical protein
MLTLWIWAACVQVRDESLNVPFAAVPHRETISISLLFLLDSDVAAGESTGEGVTVA